MGNVKKFVAERIRHQRQYDRGVNKRQMQKQKSKIDMGKAMDADLVVTESSEIESEVQDKTASQGMIQILMMQISDLYMTKSQWLRNSSKNMPRFSSNDMVHNHYLDEARKKTQERDRNSKTSLMPSARFQNTTDDSKPKLGALITQLGVCMYLRIVL
nr:hypothetical protein [Tanacetum cinerariifolium]